MKSYPLFVSLFLLSRPGASAEVHFTDITEEAGITFVHENGATGKKYLPETMGSGVAFFDFDGDGDQDLLFVNSMSWPQGPTTSALYRNKGNGSFEDVTAGSGFDRAVYGMGVAVADYDGDGDRDVYITVLGANLLFRNDGDAKHRRRRCRPDRSRGGGYATRKSRPPGSSRGQTTGPRS